MSTTTVLGGPVGRKSLEPYLFDSVEFYPHQIDGVRTLARIPSFLLADQMGLGKSVQTLAVFAIDVVLKRARTMLIICPVSLRDNWADEIEKFTTFPYLLLGQYPMKNKKSGYNLLTGIEREIQLKLFLNEPGPRIVICNYEQAVAMGPALRGFDFLTCDEAHLLKNYESKRSEAVRSIPRKRVALLTGTPLLNQVTELWPLLNMINPHRWRSPEMFENRYALKGLTGFKKNTITGVKNTNELNKVLSEVMVRRLKKDTLTLKEPNIMQVKVDLHPVQREIYERLAEELILVDGLGEETEIENHLHKFLLLKQICGSSATIAGYDDHSYKLDRAVQIVVETILNDEKIVIFTQFRSIQALLSARLKKVGIKMGELHGDVPPPRRLEIVKNWSAYQKPAALNCMIQVAGVGLNMTAARTGLFVDKLFVPGLNDQGIDRMHRIGQQETHPVEIYELIAKGTIEQRIEEILKGKRIVGQEVVEESIAFQQVYQELLKNGGVK